MRSRLAKEESIRANGKAREERLILFDSTESDE